MVKALILLVLLAGCHSVKVPATAEGQRASAQCSAERYTCQRNAIAYCGPLAPCQSDFYRACVVQEQTCLKTLLTGDED